MLTEFGNAMTLVTGLVAYGVYIKSKRKSNMSYDDLSIKLNNDINNEKDSIDSIEKDNNNLNNNNINNSNNDKYFINNNNNNNSNTSIIGNISSNNDSSSIFDNNNQLKRRLFE